METCASRHCVDTSCTSSTVLSVDCPVCYCLQFEFKQDELMWIPRCDQSLLRSAAQIFMLRTASVYACRALLTTSEVAASSASALSYSAATQAATRFSVSPGPILTLRSTSSAAARPHSLFPAASAGAYRFSSGVSSGARKQQVSELLR